MDEGDLRMGSRGPVAQPHLKFRPNLTINPSLTVTAHFTPKRRSLSPTKTIRKSQIQVDTLKSSQVTRKFELTDSKTATT